MLRGITQWREMVLTSVYVLDNLSRCIYLVDKLSSVLPFVINIAFSMNDTD